MKACVVEALFRTLFCTKTSTRFCTECGLALKQHCFFVCVHGCVQHRIVTSGTMKVLPQAMRPIDGRIIWTWTVIPLNSRYACAWTTIQQVPYPALERRLPDLQKKKKKSSPSIARKKMQLVWLYFVWIHSWYYQCHSIKFWAMIGIFITTSCWVLYAPIVTVKVSCLTLVAKQATTAFLRGPILWKVEDCQESNPQSFSSKMLHQLLQCRIPQQWLNYFWAQLMYDFWAFNLN